MTARVLVIPPADEQALKITTWWRENRPAAPYLFEDELADAFEVLAEHPEIGKPFPRRRMPDLRRYLLRETAHHIYYVFRDDLAEVRVRAVWSAVRKRGPRIVSK